MIRFLKYFFAVVFTVFCSVALSQNEAKKWYFGNYCGLDFTTNPPTNLANGAMTTWEGCASIADASGNLLFYTNGISIWNQSHLVMANGTGLLGDNSSSQSALIVKQPGNANTYFVFTTDGGSDGVRYSVVDMSLAAGMGSVTTKNVLVYAPSTERLCGTKHCNGTDTWVISHDNSNVFRATLVTAAGVTTTPVLSFIGTSLGGQNVMGCMKVSPNGKKIATALYAPYFFELYDFNPATGIVSNSLALHVTAPGYGCEFSPDGTKFYGSLWGPNNTIDKLWQWDLCAGSNQAIIASASFFNATHTGQLQLGPDGKIYLAKAREKKIKLSPEVSITVVNGEPMLGVIHNPNAGAAAVNYNNTGQAVSPAASMFGLPNFVSGFYKTPVAQFTYTVDPSISCVKAFLSAPPLVNAACSATSYTINNVQWLFGDPASGAANTSALINPEHTYPGIGTYNVRLVLYNTCGGVIDTLKQQVIVGGALSNSPSDFSLCAGQSLTLSATGSSSYSWSTGATSSSIVVTPTANTTYTVGYTDVYGCMHKSVQTITVNPVPAVTISGNDSICGGYPVTLTAGGGLSYSWNNGSTNSAISVTPAVTTTYTVTGTSFNGCSASPVFTVVVKPAPDVSITGNTLVCAGTTSTLVASGDGTHLWTNGTQGATLIMVPSQQLNVYSVKVTYLNGCVKYKGGLFRITSLPPLTVAGITTVCAGAAVTQTASGASTYSWSNGVTTNPANLVTYDNTIYTVSGTGTNNCVNTVTVAITVKPSSTVSASSATVCSGKTVTLQVTSPLNTAVSYFWQPLSISGDNIIVPATTSEVYTVTANLDGCINSATSSVVVLPSPTLIIDNDDVRVLPGLSTTLHVSGSSTYTWNPAGSLSCSDCDSPVATPAESTQYCVSTSLGECISEVCINVLVSCESDNDYSVPNAFTPNGDNNNEEFCLQGWEECITEFNVMIFDRWGEKLYESGNPSFCWDGVYKGQLLNSGVYIYVIKAKKFNSKTAFIKKGNITLVR